MINIGSLVSLLIILLVLGLLLWAVFYVLREFGTPPEIARIIRVVAVVVAVLIVIAMLLGLAGYPVIDFGGPRRVVP